MPFLLIVQGTSTTQSFGKFLIKPALYTLPFNSKSTSVKIALIISAAYSLDFFIFEFIISLEFLL